jgi:hypothetical protein
MLYIVVICSVGEGLSEMNPGNKSFKMLLLSVILCMIITGCGPAENSAKNELSSEKTESPVTVSEKKTKVKPGKKDLTISSPEPTEVDKNVDENQTAIDQPEDNNDDSSGVPTKKHPAKISNYNVTDPYDSTKPTLMGFSVNDNMEAVITRFGKPISETEMNDGIGTLQVYEYPGFIFGANESNNLVFIEVNSNNVNPGLNQFRVGQSVEEASEALGSPDSLNEYVMVYKSGGLVLKIDLDPNSSVVRSIKLFAEET